MPRTHLLKVLLFTAASLGFIIVAYVLLHQPQHAQAPFAKVVDHAEQFTIASRGETARLEKEGSLWYVSGSSPTGRFPADPEKVKSLQSALKSIQVEDVIAEHPQHPEEFEITPGSAVVITALGKGGKLAEGAFGKQASDVAHLYFKYTDRPEIYLARGAMRGELGDPALQYWRDRALTNIAEDQVQKVVIEAPGFKTALARSSDTWTCNGQPADPQGVWAMLGVLAHLRADDFVDPIKTPELAPDRLGYASVVIQLRDGSTRTLHFGKLDPRTHRCPVASDAGPLVGWVPEGTVKAIVRKPADFSPKK